jgi:hypothetical protein
LAKPKLAWVCLLKESGLEGILGLEKMQECKGLFQHHIHMAELVFINQALGINAWWCNCYFFSAEKPTKSFGHYFHFVFSL